MTDKQIDFIIEIEKTENIDGRYFVSGIASTTHKDLQNDVLTVACLTELAKSAVGTAITVRHSDEALDQIGSVISANYADNNLYIKGELDPDDPIAVRTHKKITKSKAKMGFSIGGTILKLAKNVDNSVRLTVESLLLKHICITSVPANPFTFCQAVAKSLQEENNMDNNTDFTPQTPAPGHTPATPEPPAPGHAPVAPGFVPAPGTPAPGYAPGTHAPTHNPDPHAPVPAPASPIVAPPETPPTFIKADPFTVTKSQLEKVLDVKTLGEAKALVKSMLAVSKVDIPVVDVVVDLPEDGDDEVPVATPPVDNTVLDSIGIVTKEFIDDIRSQIKKVVDEELAELRKPKAPEPTVEKSIKRTIPASYGYQEAIADSLYSKITAGV